MKRRKQRTIGQAILGAAFAVGAGLLLGKPAAAKAADYEAAIGEACYGSLEEAFEKAADGDTITVLKDCSVSATLAVDAKDITLKGREEGNLVVITRDKDFSGKFYREDVKNALLGVEGGSLVISGVILDGGALQEGDSQPAGRAWDSPLLYVKGQCRAEEGTIIQNNINTGQDFRPDGSRPGGSASGGVEVEEGGSFEMIGGLIYNCSTGGAGGGIRSQAGSFVVVTDSGIGSCRGATGGALALFGPARISGVGISGCFADNAGAAAFYDEMELSGCVIEGNETFGDGGAIAVLGDSPALIEGCVITGNHGQKTGAVSISGSRRESLLWLRDCTISDNCWEDSVAGGAIGCMAGAGMVLDGRMAVEGNFSADGAACDIYIYTGDTCPVRLGESFESFSVFTLFGEGIPYGAKLVDASAGEEDMASRFLWRSSEAVMQEREGSLYLEEAGKQERYTISYDANNNNGGTSVFCTIPEDYSGQEAVTVLDREGVFPYMGGFSKKGFDFAGWNTRKDGTGDDYQGGQEIYLTENLYLYAKWQGQREEETEYCRAVFEAGGGILEPDARELLVEKGGMVCLPLAERCGYGFTGWFLDENFTEFAGGHGDVFCLACDMVFYAGWEMETEDGTKPEEGQPGKADGNGGDEEGKEDVEAGGGEGKEDAEAGGGEGKEDVEAGGEEAGREDAEAGGEEAGREDAETGGEEAGQEDTEPGGEDKESAVAGEGEKDGEHMELGKEEESPEEGGTGEGEPFVQTGYASPVGFFLFLWAGGMLLAAASLWRGRATETPFRNRRKEEV